jgi:hypothetical protein
MTLVRFFPPDRPMRMVPSLESSEKSVRATRPARTAISRRRSKGRYLFGNLFMQAPSAACTAPSPYIAHVQRALYIFIQKVIAFASSSLLLLGRAKFAHLSDLTNFANAVKSKL